MPRSDRTNRECPVSLEEAIELFARDLFGPNHPEKDVAVRQVKASFTRNQLRSTSREFVLSTMMKLMSHTIREVVQRTRADERRFSPLVRSLLNAQGDRDLIERYLTKARRTEARRR